MVTRRAFLIGGGVAGGGLVLGLAALPSHRRASAAGLVAKADESLVTSWLKIDRNNQITVYVPHSEMGQGVHTALPMMLAEELDADWDLVQMEQAPAAAEFANAPLGKGFLLGDAKIPALLGGVVDYSLMKVAELMNLQITGGSTAVRFTGHYGMRRQGAAAKHMLLSVAAARWNVAPSSLKTESSFVINPVTGDKFSYGDLAADAALLEPPKDTALKDPKDYTIVGTSKPRFDIPGKVDGSEIYGMDVQLPNMKFAAVKMAPIFGAEVAQLDSSSVMNLPGVIKAVRLPGAVAVVADSYWQARQALLLLRVAFTQPAHNQLDSQGIFKQYDSDLERAEELGESDVAIGDIAAGRELAQRTVRSEYKVPYLAHAAMEPVNCTAWVKPDGSCEYWAGLQDALMGRAKVAEVLGLDMEQVTTHQVAMGGAFGRRGSTLNFVEQAALVAKELNDPVKLIWSREDDMQQDYYRPAISSNFEAGLNADGMPVYWQNAYIGKNEPAEAAHIPYSVANQKIDFVESETPIPFGPWRSVAHSQHGFFTESFIDELAIAAQIDTFEYRRRLLQNNPRHLKVLEAAAEKAQWGSPLPKGWGRGIALQTSFQSVVAQVVEISVDEGGKVTPQRVVCVVDCGMAINPDNVVSQMESGIVYGLTAALYGEIEIANGSVVQGNFNDYEMLRIGLMPKVETHIIESDYPLGGVGEPGTPAIAPALTNAIYDATGLRVRQLPTKNYDFAYKGRQETA